MLAAFDTPFNALIKPGIFTQIIIGIQIITIFYIRISEILSK